MQRFFVNVPLDIDITITDPDIHHQLTRVMRIQVGDSIILFNGDGSETEYQIQSIDKKSLSLRGVSRGFPGTEPQKKIILKQSLPNKYEKIEYILQKGVEVGISRFVFFRSDRSQKLILNPKKIERFEAIIRESVEQCGGLILPELVFIDSLHDDRNEYECVDIVLDTLGTIQKIHDIPHASHINLWVGPEGGWSDEERQIMNDKGFIFVHLGERVMRTETAGPVVGFSLIHA